MGDNNSSPPTTTTTTTTTTDATTNADRLNSFHPECNDLKHQYDQCFNEWFTEHYMNGRYKNNACQHIFEMYTSCVKVLIINFIIFYFNLHVVFFVNSVV